MTMATGIVVTPLLLQINRHPELWDAEHIRKYWTQHAPDIDVCEMLVRYTVGSDEVDQLQCEWRGLSELVNHAKRMALDVMAGLRAEQLGRVILTRLPPGKMIPWHSDIVGAYSKFYTRFHVPIQSDNGVIFECGGEQIHMLAGNLYWFNHALPHSISNFSDTDRINLIVDVRVS